MNFWQNFHLSKQRKTWSNWNNSSIETTVDLANFWLRTYKTFLILVVFSLVNVCIGHIKLKRIMKKKKQKKNITKKKKTIPIKVIKRSWYNMWKLLSNFAAELCNYHKQTKLFNKKEQEATHQLLRRLKKQQFTKKKKKKKIRENTLSWFLICNIIDC